MASLSKALTVVGTVPRPINTSYSSDNEELIPEIESRDEDESKRGGDDTHRALILRHESYDLVGEDVRIKVQIDRDAGNHTTPQKKKVGKAEDTHSSPEVSAWNNAQPSSKSGSDCFGAFHPVLKDFNKVGNTPSPHSKEDITFDDTSFSVFAGSFDAMSASASFMKDFPVDSPVARATPQNSSRKAADKPAHRKFRKPTTIDISIPSLGMNTSDCMGDSGTDISPIKLGPEMEHDQDMPAFSSFAMHCSQSKYWSSTNGSNPPTPEFQRRPRRSYHNTPFAVLRSCSRAFSNCSFILSYVQNPTAYHHDTPRNNSSSMAVFSSPKDCGVEYYDPRDLSTAMGRVKSAVCAFGGNPICVQPCSNGRDVIFRGVRKWSQHQCQYSERLQRRYFLCANRISWDVEEHPPVEIESTCVSKTEKRKLNAMSSMSPTASNSSRNEKTDSCSEMEGDDISSSSASAGNGGEQPKMKYRCKLCGQPKQNHRCPYRQSMQRSIGVTVLPTINAFTSHEPGSLAPALSEMNNFVSNSGDLARSDRVMAEESEEVDGILAGRVGGNIGSPKCEVLQQVTPPSSDSRISQSRKRLLGDMMETAREVPSQHARNVPLCPEQYRAISPHIEARTWSSYQYASVPLTFSERKRLTDTLFAFTQELPQSISGEISGILHDARQQDTWDQAVAEILTQVIVALYCGPEDKQLEGLHDYLLSLGISS